MNDDKTLRERIREAWATYGEDVPREVAHDIAATVYPTRDLDIAEAAEYLGVAKDTLRYYEREGLVDVPRDERGYRVYGHDEIGLLIMLTRLRVSGFAMVDLHRFVDAMREPNRIDVQRTLLVEHRARVLEQIETLRIALAVTDFKISELYGDASDGSVTTAHGSVTTDSGSVTSAHGSVTSAHGSVTSARKENS